MEVTGIFSDPEEAADAFLSTDFDVVFLDIQMPGMSGIDIVRQLGVEDIPPIIFVTAWDRNAIQAFDLHAVDYLLKPVDDDRFDEAMSRMRSRLRLNQIEDLSRRLAAALESSEVHRAAADSSRHESASPDFGTVPRTRAGPGPIF